MSHTPGPWIVEQSGYGFDNEDAYEWNVFGGDREHITTLYAEKNAHLIAAAPDLLLALKAAMEEESTPTDMTDWAIAARDAVAKAEGRS